MLDYKLIEAMAMVVREGGFDKAASALHITQSAVSQRVKLLEEYTGQILIARTTPPRATATGRRLLRHYLRVKRLEDDLAGEMEASADGRSTSIAIGLNADSLATWFPAAIQPFLIKERVLLDLRVDDQDQTHRMLKDGDVMGCISTQEHSLQGCRIDYLGQMTYHLFAAPDFAKQWFPNGFTVENAKHAPAIIYNRKDELHHKFLRQALGEVPDSMPINYVPSSEKFSDFISMGIGYGMMPLLQGQALVKDGLLIDTAPRCPMPVKLYWHCWNLNSKLLERLTRQLIQGAKKLLEIQ